MALRAAQACHFVLAVFCVFAACFELSEAAAVVDVYRMIQYDMRGLNFGSRRTGINHFASSGLGVPGSDLTRAVVVMPITKVDMGLLNEVLQGKRFVGGILLLIPGRFNTSREGESEGEEDGGEALKAMEELEQLLLHSSSLVPIYFAVEDDSLKALRKDVAANDAAGKPATATNGGYKLVVTSPDPKKLPAVTISNIQGWLHGLRPEGESAALPTIAIVAPYDTFGAAQALSTGSGSSGSAVVALLELARLFSRLYASPKTRGRYNLLFALTSGGPYNYDGTKQWLASLDQRILETLEFALCLKSLGSGTGQLYMHGSKSRKDLAIAPFYEGFEAVAAEQGLSLSVVHKKINMSDPQVPWEHEWFSRSKVAAATLTELSAPPDLFQHSGGLADRRERVDDAAVVQSIKLVAESLGRLIYGYEGRAIEIFAEGSSLGVSRPFVSHWLDLLGRTPRVAPALPKGAPIITALQKELAGHAAEVVVQTVPLDKTFGFYDSPKAALNVYQVASVTFDLLILLAVGSYLGALFVILHISTKGFDDLMGVFRRPPPRKSKTQ